MVPHCRIIIYTWDYCFHSIGIYSRPHTFKHTATARKQTLSISFWQLSGETTALTRVGIEFNGTFCSILKRKRWWNMFAGSKNHWAWRRHIQHSRLRVGHTSCWLLAFCHVSLHKGHVHVVHLIKHTHTHKQLPELCDPLLSGLECDMIAWGGISCAPLPPQCVCVCLRCVRWGYEWAVAHRKTMRNPETHRHRLNTQLEWQYVSDMLLSMSFNVHVCVVGWESEADVHRSNASLPDYSGRHDLHGESQQ